MNLQLDQTKEYIDDKFAVSVRECALVCSYESISNMTCLSPASSFPARAISNQPPELCIRTKPVPLHICLLFSSGVLEVAVSF